MENLVMVVGGYHPTFSAPGICVEKMVTYLKEHYHVTVLTFRRSDAIPDKTFWHNGVKVIQVSDAINDRMVRAKRAKRGYRFWSSIRTILSLARLERTEYWFKRALARELEILFAETRFSKLVSVGFPTTTHLACMSFRRKHEAVNWITYSTDTYFKNVQGSKFPLLSRLRSRSELACYRAASHNFFSREIMQTCGAFLSSVLHKSSGLDYLLFVPTCGVAPRQDLFCQTTINLLYAGGFVENVRSPEYVLSVLAHLPQTSTARMHFFSKGVYEDLIRVYAERCPERVVLHRPVGVSEIREIMCACQIVVNVSNDMDQFFPSKVFDYLSTGLPIVNFTYPKRIKNGLFARYPRYLDLEMWGDVERDAGRLAEFCEANAGWRMSFDEVASIYREHMPAFALREFVQKVERTKK